MVFAHDTEAALLSAAALVNTEQPERDLLTELSELDGFLERWSWTGSRTHDAAELAGVRALRPQLRALWKGEEAEVAGRVNAMLRSARALPQLVAHGPWPYHLHATPPEAPLADRMAVEAAMALVDVVRAQERERLRVCDADDCRELLVDLSRNRVRRYCSTTCGSRMNVAAFRARRGSSR